MKAPLHWTIEKDDDGISAVMHGGGAPIFSVGGFTSRIEASMFIVSYIVAVQTSQGKDTQRMMMDLIARKVG